MSDVSLLSSSLPLSNTTLVEVKIEDAKEEVKKEETKEKVTIAETKEEVTKKECSICLQEITNSSGKMVLSCQHEYHPNCIGSWFATKKNQACPLCLQGTSPLSQLPIIKVESLCNYILRRIRFGFVGLITTLAPLYLFGMSLAGSFLIGEKINDGSGFLTFVILSWIIQSITFVIMLAVLSRG